ncbi:MAG: ClpXP protease specificity-enhancing factor SspB [Sphingomonadaceae bacterium]
MMNEPPENQEPPDSLIPYDEIVQDSLRGVVKRVLADVAASGGLPGAHHFFIAFRTRHPGVDMPKHLLERYPDEMTVVIQHRYWDLVVEDDHFEIGLTFNQVPARLIIPWSAITGFVDPAVNFALQFAVSTPEPEDEPPPPPPPVDAGDSGSNVVSFDFKRKK